MDDIEIGNCNGWIPVVVFTSHLSLKSGIGIKRMMFKEETSQEIKYFQVHKQ